MLTVPPLVNAPVEDGNPTNSADPTHGLVLDLGRRPRIDGEVDVVGVGQQVAERADLEPARTDEREVARTSLRDRLVQHARGVIERLVHRRMLAR